MDVFECVVVYMASACCCTPPSTCFLCVGIGLFMRDIQGSFAVSIVLL